MFFYQIWGGEGAKTNPIIKKQELNKYLYKNPGNVPNLANGGGVYPPFINIKVFHAYLFDSFPNNNYKSLCCRSFVIRDKFKVYLKPLLDIFICENSYYRPPL